MTTRARIAGLGHHVPDRVVTNDDLAALMDTSDEWIRERTGIVERRFVEDGVTCTDLAEIASRRAMENAGWEADEVDFIIFATLSPDLYFPGNGAILQHQLGLGPVGALDVRNQCSGFVYALSAADGYIRMGLARKVLVVGAEVHSRGLVFSDSGRDTAVIFGDGAAVACVEAVEPDSESLILRHRLHADGQYARELCIVKPGSADAPYVSNEHIEAGLTAPFMNGREVFRHAVTKFPAVIREVLDDEGLEPSDVDFLVPHQANLRITEAVRQRMGLPEERVASNIMRYGNTTAASIPLALSEAVADGQVKRGDLVCLAAFGAGFTWGASLLRY
jgi:3-oxoacyl-[acyl-carrier-protein] synthase III